MRALHFSGLDWLIAWRHLRSGERIPSWAKILLVVAIYLIAVGGGLWWYGHHIDVPVEVIEGPFGPIGDDELGPTPLSRSYELFGRMTLFVGIMTFVFALLAVFFNLLTTIVTMSVLLGCMALVVVLSLMSGLEVQMRDKILAQKAHIRVSTPTGQPFADYEAIADAIEQASEVAGASPYLEGEVLLRSGFNRQAALVQGILPERHRRAANLAELVREGDYEYLSHPEKIPDYDPFAAFDELPEVASPPLPEAAAGRTATGSIAVEPDEPPKEPQTDELEEEGWEDSKKELGADEPPAPIKLPSLDPFGRADPFPHIEPAPKTVPKTDDDWEDPLVELGDPAPAPSEHSADAPSHEADADGPSEPPSPTEQAEDQTGDASEGHLPPVLVGREMAAELGVRIGAEVQLVTPVGRMTPAGEIPGVMAAKVAGVFFSGMYEYDRKNVYLPLPTAQRFLLTGDRVSGIEVRLVDVDALDAGKEAVTTVIEQLGRSDEFVVEDWRDLNRSLFSAMFLEKVAMFIALLFVVLVASFGILASILMSVLEKNKEIAILKTMGIADQGIMRVFIAEGLCIGIVGSLSGIAIGLAVCSSLSHYGLPIGESLFYTDKLPVVVNPFEVALVGIAALFIVCISSIYPAFVASRIRPVDAFRQTDH